MNRRDALKSIAALPLVASGESAGEDCTALQAEACLSVECEALLGWAVEINAESMVVQVGRHEGACLVWTPRLMRIPYVAPSDLPLGGMVTLMRHRFDGSKEWSSWGLLQWEFRDKRQRFLRELGVPRREWNADIS